jgi:hypothetical protein
MRLRHILCESDWWDDSPTVRLYHGTSSANVPDIQKNGMRPIDVSGFMADYANSLIPSDQQSEWLRGVLDRLHVRDGSVRSGDRGNVLYFFTEPSEVAGYARSYAQHGAELAADVLSYVNAERKDDGLPPLPPRFPDGKPVIIEVEIPKDWCLWSIDPTTQRTKVIRAWETNADWAKRFPSLEDALKRAMRRVEVRVPRPIPPEMIASIRPVPTETK